MSQDGARGSTASAGANGPMPDHVQGGAGVLGRSTTSRGKNPQYDAGNLTHAQRGAHISRCMSSDSAYKTNQAAPMPKMSATPCNHHRTPHLHQVIENSPQ